MPQTDRDRQKDRQRPTETETDTERQRVRETEKQRDRDRRRQRRLQPERQRHSKIYFPSSNFFLTLSLLNVISEPSNVNRDSISDISYQHSDPESVSDKTDACPLQDECIVEPKGDGVEDDAEGADGRLDDSQTDRLPPTIPILHRHRPTQTADRRGEGSDGGGWCMDGGGFRTRRVNYTAVSVRTAL